MSQLVRDLDFGIGSEANRWITVGIVPAMKCPPRDRLRSRSSDHKTHDGTDYAEAQEWLVRQLARIYAPREGVRPRFTFEEAACRYLQEHQKKPSLDSDMLYLKLAMPYVGSLLLDEICDETLEALVAGLKAPVVTRRQDGTETIRVRKNKTVNLVLATIDTY
jgi:hypothetical protein